MLLKNNLPLDEIIKSSFSKVNILGGMFIILIMFCLSTFVLLTDQKNGCVLSMSILNQYRESISRELTLQNIRVAESNFGSFLTELNEVSIIPNLKIDLQKSLPNVANSRDDFCRPRVFYSQISIPLKFGFGENGAIVGSIKYYPSLFVLFLAWSILFVFMILFKIVETNLKLQLKKYVIKPILFLSNDLPIDTENCANEVILIAKNISDLKQNALQRQQLVNEISKNNELTILSAQLSHDIRSPLSALKLVTASLGEIPDQKKEIINSSIERITDIANKILEKHKTKNTIEFTNFISDPTYMNCSESIQKVSLFPIVDSIFKEKKIEFCEQKSISINLNSAIGPNLYVNVDRLELKRVISNLINNSIESLKDGIGFVMLELFFEDNFACLVIKDNGKGIPNEIIEKIGTLGFSYGKEKTNSGIGLYHAKKTVENLKGRFEIKSKTGVGTEIKISFKESNSPRGA